MARAPQQIFLMLRYRLSLIECFATMRTHGARAMQLPSLGYSRGIDLYFKAVVPQFADAEPSRQLMRGRPATHCSYVHSLLQPETQRLHHRRVSLRQRAQRHSQVHAHLVTFMSLQVALAIALSATTPAEPLLCMGGESKIPPGLCAVG